VIPLFIEAFLNRQSPKINGDGQHSRDFTYVRNVVEANALSLFTDNKKAINQVYNIGYGQQTSLQQLFQHLKKISQSNVEAEFVHERPGDVRHSLADISKAKSLLGYDPKISVEEGLMRTFKWFKEKEKIL
jgi:UDP-N-acetylglucosamine 4-epimerase